MIFEAPRLLKKVERISFSSRTDITDKFLESLPQDTGMYQAFFIGKEEKMSKENVTVTLLEAFKSLNDTERTCLMKVARRMVGEKSA
jgi:hypothetical protein